MAGLTQTQELILDLAAASMFGKQVNIPGDVDWQAVLQECRHQSVALQVFSAAQPYLSEETKKQWRTHCSRMIANNMRVEWEHSELHGILSAAAVPYVVMKGCASAAYYRDPSVRALGDVDFLVRTEDLDRAGKLLENAGFSSVADDEEDIHIAYHRPGAGAMSIWEMHWRPNGVPDTAVGDVIRDYLSTAIDEATESRTLTGSYMGPSAFHHGLIMLLHTATHLINTGVGLRHLCDWAAFAGALSQEAFCELFEEKLKNVGLWRFAQLLTQLSVAYLGCPESAWAGEADPELLEAMICDIFAGGNFGSKDEQRINQAKLMTNKGKGSVDDTSFWKQLAATMNEKARLGFPASARYPVLLPIGWLYVGIRHLLRILMGKRPRIDINEMISGANERKNVYKQFALFQKE